MASSVEEAVLLFLALVGLYSPVAAVSSYLPVLQPFNPRQQLRIAIGLFINVAGIAIVTVLLGEPLLHVLGLTTAALSATGGISLMIAAVPLMTGRADPPAEPPASAATDQDDGPAGAEDLEGGAVSWRSVVFMPMTFPLTVGGATIGILVGFRAEVSGVFAIGALVVAAAVYAAVTGLCAYISGHVQRRVSGRTRVLLDRVAGILLVAIAATLLASGFTRLVIDVLHSVKIL
jgi:multiple antibiotic resistance protein